MLGVKPLKGLVRKDKWPTNPRRKGTISVKAAYTQLNQYARLLSELNDHYDEDLDRVVIFRYSDELIQAMNEHEVYNPDDAWLVFADRIDELLEELAVAVQK
jgi:hypothetical protein